MHVLCSWLSQILQAVKAPAKFDETPTTLGVGLTLIVLGVIFTRVENAAEFFCCRVDKSRSRNASD